MRHKNERMNGFSLLELLVAVVIFLLITGAAFTLLNVSQQRYQMESQVLDSLQEARLGMDQMVRDINDAGFPPPNHFTASAPPANTYAQTPFAWMPSYPATPCTVGGVGGCTTPTGIDIIVETKPDPTLPVQWIHYVLVGKTLMRGVANKDSTTDPVAATADKLMPYVQNVVNGASAAEIAAFKAGYSGTTMFPGDNPVAIFSYVFDSGAAATPRNIRDVNITLIVQAAQLDPRTRQPRLVTLTGRGRRINPNT